MTKTETKPENDPEGFFGYRAWDRENVKMISAIFIVAIVAFAVYKMFGVWIAHVAPVL